MPDLDAFEAEVKAHIKQLLVKDATKRRQAAEWLGEAGDPTAITSLAQAYKNDADPRVRKAAGYSLGMFRKLELELASPKSDKAMKLLEQVADGKMGGRVPIAIRTVAKLEFALLLSAVLVAVLAFVLPSILIGGGAPQTSGNNNDTTPQVVNVPDKDRITIINELRSASGLVSNNATKLQGQYQKVLGGGALTCNEFFDSLTPLALSSNNTRDYADLAEIATTINQAEADFAAAKVTYDQVCDENQTVAAGEFGQPMAMTIAIVQQLTTAGEALTAAELQTSADGTSAAPVEIPTAETLPTSSLAADIRTHITPLQTIIDDMTAPRGAHTLLTTYWSEAATSGVTDGCRETLPIIPDDYPLAADLAAAAPNLKLSVDLVNTGLRLVREGWTQFSTSCADGTVGLVAPTSLENLNNAKTAFDAAATQLAGLRAGG